MPVTLATVKFFLIAAFASLLFAVGAGGYAWWVSSTAELEIQAKQQRIDELSANRDMWHQRAKRWEADAMRLQEERDAARLSVEKLRQARDKNDEQHQSIGRMIEQSPDTDDGPVAPVLRRTIEALP